jgi:hypothetical protein
MPGYIDQADKAFSLLVRLRAADSEGIVVCVTCGVREHWTDVDCGHFIPRQHMATRFDTRNTGPQCRPDNRVRGGLPAEFAQYIDFEHGVGTANALLQESRQVFKRTKAEVIEMAAQFRSEVARLKKEKGL